MRRVNEAIARLEGYMMAVEDAEADRQDAALELTETFVAYLRANRGSPPNTIALDLVKIVARRDLD